MEKIIEIYNLKKYYEDVKAVDGISFDVEKGILFAFLGLNGAGKSTTINILCTLLPKDSGKVLINGFDLDKSVNEIKSKIGIVFQSSVLDDKLTVKQNLTVRASYYGIRGDELNYRIKELTELLELKDIMNRTYGKLSGGQKRRVDIARGLINKPEILFLDEPTTGLDPQTRQKVWKVINDMRKSTGMTVFLTTHYMEEANEADNVVILDCGKIIANGTPNYLKQIYSGNYIKLYCQENLDFNKALVAEGCDFHFNQGSYNIKMKNSKQAKDIIIKYGKYFDDFEVIKGDMDDVFLNATGKKLEV
jgi:ABC-type multidrug transport system ATPase subunit